MITAVKLGNESAAQNLKLTVRDALTPGIIERIIEESDIGQIPRICGSISLIFLTSAANSSMGGRTSPDIWTYPQLWITQSYS